MRTLKVSLAIVIVLAFSGCADIARQQAAQRDLERQQAAANNFRRDVEALASQLRTAKQTDPLRPLIDGKVPLDPREITFAMMANPDKPTDAEKEAIARSAEISLQYQKKMLELMRRYLAPSALISLTESAYMQGTVLALELYQGRWTYGEYNTKQKQLYTQYLTDSEQTLAMLRRQQNEALMQAEQLAATRQQQALASYQMYNQMLQTLQQGNRTVTCSYLGTYSYCRY